MAQVFISHSSKDRTFIEEELTPLLRRYGVTFWYSTDDIPSSSIWEKTIRAGLLSSDYFLVVISSNSIESEWVQTEVQWALVNRKDRLIPLVVDDADPSLMNLQLIRYQHIDFRQDAVAARDRLLAVWGKRVADRFSLELTWSVEYQGCAEPSGKATFATVISELATIGRSHDCDLQLQSVHVSRHHAALRVRVHQGMKTLWLSDMGSTLGVLLNGQRLGSPTMLEAGDVFSIHDVSVRIDNIKQIDKPTRDVPEILKTMNTEFEHEHSLPAEFETPNGSLQSPAVQRLFGREASVFAGPQSGTYRVFRVSQGREYSFEELAVAIDGDSMRVVSEQFGWTSIGQLTEGRFVGRFKYNRGATRDDVGVHDMVWDGSQFTGSLRFDNGVWEADDLLWRPERPLFGCSP